MSKTTANPFQDLLTLRDRMNRLFEESLGKFSSVGDQPTTGYWSPPVDIFEDYERVVFRVDLPGVQREDVEVNVDDGNLVLRGERKMNPDIRRENIQLLERSFGPFRRLFRLPPGVDTEKVHAEIRDGILTITLVKRAEDPPKRVQIQVD
jgi:HSP20 family protein